MVETCLGSVYHTHIPQNSPSISHETSAFQHSLGCTVPHYTCIVHSKSTQPSIPPG